MRCHPWEMAYIERVDIDVEDDARALTVVVLVVIQRSALTHHPRRLSFLVNLYLARALAPPSASEPNEAKDTPCEVCGETHSNSGHEILPCDVPTVEGATSSA